MLSGYIVTTSGHVIRLRMEGIRTAAAIKEKQSGTSNKIQSSSLGSEANNSYHNYTLHFQTFQSEVAHHSSGGY